MQYEYETTLVADNGIEYRLVGDCYLPNLMLPEESRSIGFWGRLHRDYLKEHHPIRYDDLTLSGQFWTYLADLNEQAQSRLERIIRQMQEAENVTEDLKMADQLAWVQAMNSIRNRAEEIVLHELIYGEVTI